MSKHRFSHDMIAGELKRRYSLNSSNESDTRRSEVTSDTEERTASDEAETAPKVCNIIVKSITYRILHSNFHNKSAVSRTIRSTLLYTQTRAKTAEIVRPPRNPTRNFNHSRLPVICKLYLVYGTSSLPTWHGGTIGWCNINLGRAGILFDARQTAVLL